MRILALIESPTGGEERAVKALLAELKKQGVIVYLHYLPALVKTGLFSYCYWVLRSVLTTASITWGQRDVKLVYTSTYTAAAGSLLIKKLTGQHLVFHYHGDRIPPLPLKEWPLLRRLTQTVKHFIVGTLHQLAWKHVELFCAPSQAALSQLQKLYPHLGKKQLILSNGVDLSEFYSVSEAQRQSLRKRFHLDQQALILAVIGRVNEQKNILGSIQWIVNNLDVISQKVELIIASPESGVDLSYLEEIKNSLKQTALPYKLYFDHTPIREIYQVSDCVITHSAVEVSPLILLEAAACGVPLLAQPNGSTETYLRAIDHRLVLDKKTSLQEIIQLLHDKHLQRKLLAYAQKHTWGDTALHLLTELQSLDQT